MAYDKVVDSSVLDAGLKQVADAIREKGGTSDNLAFPTGMAAAVSAIQAGGGGGGASEVVVASDCSNGVDVWQLFNPMGDEESECDVWMLKADASTLGVNNQLVYLLLHKFRDKNAINGGTWSGAYVRYRSGVYQSESNMTNSYDLKVSAGDTYIHWALKL